MDCARCKEPVAEADEAIAVVLGRVINGEFVPTHSVIFDFDCFEEMYPFERFKK